MTEHLYSSHWHRIANITISLRQHVKISPHVYRGQHWYVLRNDSNGTHHRFNQAAYDFIKLVDGQRSINEIWELSLESHGEQAPTQDETIQLLGKLYFADHISSDSPQDIQELLNRRQKHQRRLLHSKFGNPLAARFALIDPDQFLSRSMPWVKPLFTKTAAIIWLVIVLWAVLLMVRYWPSISRFATEQALSPGNLLQLLLVYPCIKVVHELGHGYAVKNWGGEVHEMGLMLLILMPVPYVNASAASSFSNKYQRMLVGAAGIAVELFLAALALIIWVNSEAGWVNSLMFNIMLLGGISTLLFNGNPLLRFDGYYVLADALEIPGLANRANQYYAYLIQRYVFSLQHAQSPVHAPGEALIFILFGAASCIYRLLLLFSIVVYIAGKYFFIGIALALWAIFSQICQPLFRQLKYLLHSPQLLQQRGRAVGISSVILCLLAMLVFMLPLPFNTLVEGVVWLPEKSHVRAAADGFIQEVLVEDGVEVDKGQALLISTDPTSAMRLKILQAQLQELQLRHTALRQDKLVKASVLEEEIKLAKEKLVQLQLQIDELVIRSPSAGMFILPNADRLLGHYLHKGDPIAYVVTAKDTSIRVVVAQSDIGQIRQYTQGIEARLVGRIQQVFKTQIKQAIPAASTQLPTKALAQIGGGKIQTDPFDSSGMQAQQPYFQFDLQLSTPSHGVYIGQRVYVRFKHGNESLARQWYRSFEELFLDEFKLL